MAAHRRRYPTRGASKLRWALRQAFAAQRLPSLRTVERWLQADGLSQAPRRRRRITAQRLQRYRRARRANELWTIDLKGWCRTGDQAKIEPLTIRDLGSRFILWNQPLPRRNDESVRRVCRRLFRRHGCPKAIRTDLGAPFCSIGPYRLTSLSLWWYRLNIGVEFVFRRGGIDNNAHEQMHSVLEAAPARPPAPAAHSCSGCVAGPTTTTTNGRMMALVVVRLSNAIAPRQRRCPLCSDPVTVRIGCGAKSTHAGRSA